MPVPHGENERETGLVMPVFPGRMRGKQASLCRQPWRAGRKQASLCPSTMGEREDYTHQGASLSSYTQGGLYPPGCLSSYTHGRTIPTRVSLSTHTGRTIPPGCLSLHTHREVYTHQGASLYIHREVYTHQDASLYTQGGIYPPGCLSPIYLRVWYTSGCLSRIPQGVVYLRCISLLRCIPLRVYISPKVYTSQGVSQGVLYLLGCTSGCTIPLRVNPGLKPVSQECDKMVNNFREKGVKYPPGVAKGLSVAGCGSITRFTVGR